MSTLSLAAAILASDALAYRFLDLESGTNTVEEWTYADIDRRARSLAVHLRLGRSPRSSNRDQDQ